MIGYGIRAHLIFLLLMFFNGGWKTVFRCINTTFRDGKVSLNSNK